MKERMNYQTVRPSVTKRVILFITIGSKERHYQKFLIQNYLKSFWVGVKIIYGYQQTILMKTFLKTFISIKRQTEYYNI